MIFINKLFCKLLGHKWKINEVYFLGKGIDVSISYGGFCSRCEDKRKEKLQVFKNSGEIEFVDDFGRKTFPD